MNPGRFMPMVSLGVLVCLACRPCAAQVTNSYNSPTYDGGYQMWVSATIYNPSQDQQFWASPGVADICFDVYESASSSFGEGAPQGGGAHSIGWHASADVYIYTSTHWSTVDDVQGIAYLPTAGLTFSSFTHSMYAYDDLLGSSQTDGGIEYHLTCVSDETDQTYYPGFGATTAVQVWYNCACACS